MDLQISLFLLFILFTGVHSLSCYDCTTESGSCNQTNRCPAGFTNCFNVTTAVNSTTVNVTSCAPSVCPSGSVNISAGQVSFLCCNTDPCNLQDAPDPSNNTSSVKSCYSCDGENCSNTVNCSGSEDHCFNATGAFRNYSLILKGCVSEIICNASTLITNIHGILCCNGSLCNGAQNTTHSTNGVQSTTQSTTQSSTHSSTHSSTQSSTHSTTQSTNSVQSTTNSTNGVQNTTWSSTQSTTKSPNGSQSVTQSFLFLCCSLLSFILLH
uniref:Lymphocyte antigen 6 family member M7 n=1 Tax=Cyprinus carpio TaxID=7962 RepID=A0A8C2K199_CYPCA